MSLLIQLDREWSFRRLPAEAGWESVDLPHSPFVADLDGRQHWFGECEYQRTVQLPADPPTGRTTLYVGAAMHTTVVLVDGQLVGQHSGGYLPFEIDLTQALRDGRPHTLILRVDNQESPDVPPGKPYADLDFCWYGGLYRGAELRCSPALHITDPVGAGETASGGVFIRTLAASSAAAKIRATTHILNVAGTEQRFDLEVAVLDGTRQVAKARRRSLTIAAGSATTIEVELDVAQPALWQLDSPTLHHVLVTLQSPEGAVIDTHTVRFGIRRISFSRPGGFTLNGQRLRPRGTNRHQEYPYVGYAVPPAAQHRDARRIKEAGFDFVRLSHYPQSPAFLDACDELGILVMNSIPGWQFIGGERFQAACYQNARDLIRRDRNHPSVVLWEVSLNETPMNETFMARLHSIGHEEYPGDQMFTCGWMDRFDVYIHSRQHGEIHRWKNGDKALVIAEYGDWEFFASNHGFDQKTGAGVYAAWSHGRHRRKDGERGLRQQASNHIIALNDTLSSPAAFDGQWSMFDYARGYDPDRAACGIMDIFRLPKFSYYFYRSQRSPSEGNSNWTGGGMIFIASLWTAASDLRVLVFSNCEKVELRLNGALLGRQKPNKAWMTQYLPHPPFVFDLPAFAPGTLEATGFIGCKPVVSHKVATPATPARMELEIDATGVFAAAGEPDVLIAHARVVDAQGFLCIGETVRVDFQVEGNVALVGPASIRAEAGIASAVICLKAGCGKFVLSAQCSDFGPSFAASSEWRHPSLSAPATQRTAPAALAGAFK